MMACTASGERRVPRLLQRTVDRKWGAQGLDFVLLLLAQEVVQHADGSVRNAFAKVIPEKVLDRVQYEELTARLLAPHAEAESSVSDINMLCQVVADYLNAVQRDDVDEQDRIVSPHRHGQPGDLATVREIVLELAALHSPSAQAPPSPPAT
jgi:hypothetical protein